MLTRSRPHAPALLAAPLLSLLAALVPRSAPAGDGDPRLVPALDALLAGEGVRAARVGVSVWHLGPGGRRLYGARAEVPLHPASNTKIVTTAAALELLGPAYVHHTDLAVDKLEGGVSGELYLIGGGDPRFVGESLWSLVEDARLAGLKTVKGDLIVDESFFGPEHEAPGYADKDQDTAYRAPSGATTLNWNAVTVKLKPGRLGEAPVVELYPDGDYAEIVNTASTTKGDKERLTVVATGVDAPGGSRRTRLAIGGTIGASSRGATVRKRIDDPALFTGHAARKWLGRAGITVKGKVRVGAAPGKRRRLGRVESRPMAMLAADVNKFSNNIMAEHLMRTLGREKGGAGDWNAGREVVSTWLRKSVGIDGFTYRNGSGLFGDTAFSADHLVAILRHVHGRRPALPEFAASLAIGGVDGTLRKRLRDLPRGAVRAKTGTLDGVICLAGYVTLKDGSEAAFAFLTNDVRGAPWRIWKAQDDLVRVLAGFDPGSVEVVPVREAPKASPAAPTDRGKKGNKGKNGKEGKKKRSRPPADEDSPP